MFLIPADQIHCKNHYYNCLRRPSSSRKVERIFIINHLCLHCFLSSQTPQLLRKSSHSIKKLSKTILLKKFLSSYRPQNYHNFFSFKNQFQLYSKIIKLKMYQQKKTDKNFFCQPFFYSFTKCFTRFANFLNCD